MNENSKYEIYDKTIVVWQKKQVESENGEPAESKLERFSPYAIENCMNPGTFQVIPLQITVEDGKVTVCYRNIVTAKDEKKMFSLDAVRRGELEVTSIPFVPKRKQYRSNCTHCVNCGRCSW